MASCWDPTIQVHCIVLGVILSSGHKHADLFPSLPKGRNHLPYHIWNRLIFHVPLLRNRNNCWLELSGSDAGVGFCRAPLPPLGGIMTSPGAQHPFGAFSNRTICARPIPFVEEQFLWQVLIRKRQKPNQILVVRIQFAKRKLLCGVSSGKGCSQRMRSPDGEARVRRITSLMAKCPVRELCIGGSGHSVESVLHLVRQTSLICFSREVPEFPD